MEYLMKIDITARFACFTPPYAKAEKRSYPVPTASALRGAIESVYLKRNKFRLEIRQIEVMNDIKYVTVKTNGVDKKMGRNLAPINLSDPGQRIQFVTSYLSNVHYRVTIAIIPLMEDHNLLNAVVAQMKRRLTSGQCFRTPYLGTRECVCTVELADELDKTPPIAVSQDFGLMVYDTYNPHDNSVDGEQTTSLFHCVMENGVITLPPYDSPEVIKLGGRIHV